MTPNAPLFVVQRVRDLEAVIGVISPGHLYAVVGFGPYSHQGIGVVHLFQERFLKAKGFVDVLNGLVRVKDISVLATFGIGGVGIDGEIASVTRYLRPGAVAILVVQRLEIRSLGL